MYVLKFTYYHLDSYVRGYRKHSPEVTVGDLETAMRFKTMEEARIARKEIKELNPRSTVEVDQI